MHRSLTLLGLGLVLATVALVRLGGSAGAAHAVTNCDTTEAELDAQEQQFLVLLNQERASLGAGPLVAAPILNQMAAWKSADSSAVGAGLSHTDSLGRDPFVRASQCGLPHSVGGENILYGTSSAQSAFNLWKSSPLHYSNMTNPSWKSIGIGRQGSAWTTDFSSYNDAGIAPATSGSTKTATPSPTPTKTPIPTPTPLGGRGFAIIMPAVSKDDATN
ncbi:MAG: CAP domain-containing protein [Chloroflexi bacterium]|nr:CAP domain-containing protein [Chloroflexota bacterium]